jgi:hypothetical protein
MFDGFLLYELILLILGIVFFLVLLFIAVYLLLKGQPVKNILKLFVIPIIMIGWPGIQKVKFLNGLVEIEMLADRVDGEDCSRTSRRRRYRPCLRITSGCGRKTAGLQFGCRAIESC